MGASTKPKFGTEWSLLFGREETGHLAAAAFAESRLGADAPTHGTVEAMLGIAWTDPTFPIIYFLLVNKEKVGMARKVTGGRELRSIALKPGTNRLDWGIRHVGAGWKNSVFLKVGEKVFKLKDDKDPSPGTGDDVSEGDNIRVKV